MPDFFWGLLVGGGICTGFAFLRHYIVENQRVARQEKDIILLRKQVEGALTTVERIIQEDL